MNDEVVYLIERVDFLRSNFFIYKFLNACPEHQKFLC